jgi:hypothetical protein
LALLHDDERAVSMLHTTTEARELTVSAPLSTSAADKPRSGVGNGISDLRAPVVIFSSYQMLDDIFHRIKSCQQFHILPPAAYNFQSIKYQQEICWLEVSNGLRYII